MNLRSPGLEKNGECAAMLGCILILVSLCCVGIVQVSMISSVDNNQQIRLDVADDQRVTVLSRHGDGLVVELSPPKANQPPLYSFPLTGLRASYKELGLGIVHERLVPTIGDLPDASVVLLVPPAVGRQYGVVLTESSQPVESLSHYVQAYSPFKLFSAWMIIIGVLTLLTGAVMHYVGRYGWGAQSLRPN